jgi:8-oxo-dGTP pyrophosphatase MutT (NUDIX family)
MNLEPQKFFVGLMEFFSILLPGALLTYLLMDEVGPVVLGNGKYVQLTGDKAGAESAGVFFVASYLLGHVVFLLGAWWLDEFYDWVRRYTLNSQVRRLARRGRLLPWIARAPIWLVFKREGNLAVRSVEELKIKSLDGLGAKDTVNAFQWSKIWLSKEHPESLATVQRFEADSKFFRSFVVVLLFLAVTWPLHQYWPAKGLAVLFFLFLLALWRYMEQRHKATNQAYWAVLSLTAKNGRASDATASPAQAADKTQSGARSPTHAGGVVVRKRWWQVRYLLVEAKDHPGQWVLPKGHVEAGEQHCDTAVREVHEETGVWARIVRDLRDVTWSAEGKVITTRFFLMQALGCGLRKEKDRRHDWLPVDQAIARASHIETRELLQEALATRALIETAEQQRARR